MRTKQFDETVPETCFSTGDMFWLLDLIAIHALRFYGTAWQNRGVSSWWGDDRGQAAVTDKLLFKKTRKDQSLYI